MRTGVCGFFLLLAAGAAFAAEPASPPPAPPPVVYSPFGPPWDPTRPPPVEPAEKGAGLTAATVVASGPVDVEELRDRQPDGQPPFYGVVLDVKIAAGSTTTALTASSVTLELEGGAASPLRAVCTPTMDDATGFFRGSGASMAAWNIAIGGRTWFCGGRTARLATTLGDGGIRLSAPAAAEWSGPLVLLFEPRAEASRRVVLPGLRVELAPSKDAPGAGAPANDRHDAPGDPPTNGDGRTDGQREAR